jgi:hypothetical protein
MSTLEPLTHAARSTRRDGFVLAIVGAITFPGKSLVVKLAWAVFLSPRIRAPRYIGSSLSDP